MSRLVLLSEALVADLVLCAAAGAVFATLGLGPEPARPRNALVIVALVVVILVILGAGLMAGHWGSPA